MGLAPGTRLGYALAAALLTAASTLPSAQMQTQRAITLDTVLERFRAYLDACAQEYSAIVAAERFTQVYHPLRVVLESEFAIVRPRGTLQWLGFRDVRRVDGKEIASPAGRLAALMANPSATSLGIAARIAAESARFNVGHFRTINNPAIALEVLDPRHREAATISYGPRRTPGVNDMFWARIISCRSVRSVLIYVASII